MNAELPEVTLRPSSKLEELIAIFGGLRAAAEAWGVEAASLQRFLKLGAGINGDTVATLIVRTGLPYERLFENQVKGAKR